MTDAVLLIATILFWAYALDWAGYRFAPIQRFVHPPPLLLVRNGRLVRENMRRELITEDELMSQLRLRGVHDVSAAREAFMEGGGGISVVPEDAPGEQRQPTTGRPL